MFESLTGSFKSVINKFKHFDDEKTLKSGCEELKKSLLKADMHHKVVKELVAHVETETKRVGIGREAFLSALEGALKNILDVGGNQGFVFSSRPPTVILMTGLQGSGKTTTTAKLANYLKLRGKKVLMAACDLQRLAAVEQLRQLSLQIEVDLYAEDNSQNAVNVAKNALTRAQEGLYDVLLIDSAGRLAIDETLMCELADVKKAIIPHEVFYVADSLTGQDAVRTAATFKEKIGIDGVILTKFDGDSKGGIAIGLADQIKVPLRFIGTGEKIPDLEPFIPERIIGRLLGAGDIEGLAEKVGSVINAKEAKTIQQKIKKGTFTFDDFIAQIEQMKKMGSMSSIIGMIPGMSELAPKLKDIDLENSPEIRHMKAMVGSMTKKERSNPELLNGSRKKRIAVGAGLSIVQINRYLKQFDNAAKMAKKMASSGGIRDMMSMMGQMRGPHGMR